MPTVWAPLPFQLRHKMLKNLKGDLKCELFANTIADAVAERTKCLFRASQPVIQPAIWEERIGSLKVSLIVMQHVCRNADKCASRQVYVVDADVGFQFPKQSSRHRWIDPQTLFDDC